jgi:hypothetical protein
MSPLQLDYLVQKEKYQDMIRAAEQDRLLQAFKLQQAGQPGLYRTLANRVGVLMVTWGSKLQKYGSAPAASTAATGTEYLPN